MKKMVLALMVFGLGACATVAQNVSYRAANHEGAAWGISAKSENGVLKNDISILINGEVVASGSLHDLKPKDTFNGSYKGRNVSAECEVKTMGMVVQNACSVFIDNERAATLTF